MLSALAFTIHDDVRNNENQELNLSSHPPTLAVQRASYKKAALLFARQMERTGKAMSGSLQQHPIRR
ncbi:hypothetical protein AWB69_08526 [Caballeronia udeis]|uniref:Uncharacterized protein n=1 Tax=Caballeronia udeis TaxID=1232866 RepID=A0A158JQT5_9BURK|nr:hypothetical protein AWB69_08526 [Caballeronia udeis]